MADQSINAVGCLGRALTILGALWLGFVVLGGIGVLSDVGISEGFFAGAFGSAIPGVLLLWAGRVVRRRARTMATQIEPVAATQVPRPTEKRVPTIRIGSSHTETAPPPILPSPSPVRPQPKPVPPLAENPAAEPVDLPPPLVPPEPKTSRQLIDEARKRWGSGGRT